MYVLWPEAAFRPTDASTSFLLEVQMEMVVLAQRHCAAQRRAGHSAHPTAGFGVLSPRNVCPGHVTVMASKTDAHIDRSNGNRTSMHYVTVGSDSPNVRS